jgi:hypothetical protein
VITYLRMTRARQAFLINFHGMTLKEGLKSFLGSRVIGSPKEESGVPSYPAD